MRLRTVSRLRPEGRKLPHDPSSFRYLLSCHANRNTSEFKLRSSGLRRRHLCPGKRRSTRHSFSSECRNPSFFPVYRCYSGQSLGFHLSLLSLLRGPSPSHRFRPPGCPKTSSLDTLPSLSFFINRHHSFMEASLTREKVRSSKVGKSAFFSLFTRPCSRHRSQF